MMLGERPLAVLAPPFTKEDLEAHVKHVLSVAKERFILGTADQVSPNGDIGFVALISKVLHSASTQQKEEGACQAFSAFGLRSFAFVPF